jgi:hypothetical protein
LNLPTDATSIVVFGKTEASLALSREPCKTAGILLLRVAAMRVIAHCVRQHAVGNRALSSGDCNRQVRGLQLSQWQTEPERVKNGLVSDQRFTLIQVRCGKRCGD